MPLGAGEALRLPAVAVLNKDAANIYLIASLAGQKVYWATDIESLDTEGVAAAGGGGGPATIADGADVAEGATTDASVAAGAAGTLSAKLRRLTTDLGTLLTQTDGIEASLTSLDGKTTAANTGAVVLAAGSAIAGKVGIDQTTPGTTNLVAAGGTVASGATDSGNPVKTGGKYNATLPTLTDGQRGDVQLDSRAQVLFNLGTKLDPTNDIVGTVEQVNLGAAGIATQLFSATVAGSATLSKTKWPSTYAATLPAVGSGVAGFTAITETGVTVGGVFSPGPTWGGVLLDFAGVGNADLTLVVEIGSLTANGCMPRVIGSVSLKSITTNGTFTANFNPFTGAAVGSTTYRLFDLATVASRDGLGRLLVNLGGLEDNTPCQLILDVANSPFFYVLVTTLGLAGPCICCLAPVP